ncbi:hypothetical protein ZIOFF_072607 [Zingiber officinale]|uniref:Uncharacterized protein n=1 Tax=Zingiber officinale TaxID=94328 RepID=A0A8J5BZ34_ZINOF|nr:hypothetical protein ZIOFF_072607 [Zingiber officinale]
METPELATALDDSSLHPLCGLQRLLGGERDPMGVIVPFTPSPMEDRNGLRRIEKIVQEFPAGRWVYSGRVFQRISLPRRLVHRLPRGAFCGLRRSSPTLIALWDHPVCGIFLDLRLHLSYLFGSFDGLRATRSVRKQQEGLPAGAAIAGSRQKQQGMLPLAGGAMQPSPVSLSP